MAKDVFDTSSAIEVLDALNKVSVNSSRFNWKLYEAFVEACLVYLNVLFKQDNTSKDLAELEKVIRKKIGNKFNTKFRDARFQMSLLAIQIWLRLQVLGRYINTCLIHGQNGITIS